MTQTGIMSDARIPLAVPSLEGNAARYLQECLDTNFVSSVGPFVSRFEAEFASYVGARNAVACSNGTAALHVAMRVAGIEPGDEVMVSDFTFVATVNPITYLGARPVLVDADEATWNISPALVVDELNRRARSGARMPTAVLAAHIVGLPANLAPICEACERHGVLLIEDAAEARGASYVGGSLAGRQVGTVGVMGCFSFNGNKIITSGGGGMIVTQKADLAKRARHLTKQARLPGPDYVHDEIGYNYRLTNLAAALGVAQLEKLDEFVDRKRSIAHRYDAAFANLPGVTLPPRPEWANPTCWLYSIVLNPAATGVQRQAIQHLLTDAGIETRSLWVPAHCMPFYKEATRLGGSVGERLFANGISLPCSVSLTEADQDRVIQGVAEALSLAASG
jgi:dTDP-4-amino-4,6-dideoxygalactose transaminase